MLIGPGRQTHGIIHGLRGRREHRPAWRRVAGSDNAGALQLKQARAQDVISYRYTWWADVRLQS